MADLNAAPSLGPAESPHAPRATAWDLVVHPPAAPPVRLLLVVEWLDSLSVHLAWPWVSGDVHAGVRQAYRLEDASGRPLPVVDSRVMPLAGRMNEVTYFDTQGLEHAQTLDLRLRCRLVLPVEIPFVGPWS